MNAHPDTHAARNVAEPAMNLYDEFAWRGMIYHATPEFEGRLAAGKTTAYIGFDPTAASLHVGSLLPIMALARLQKFGHSPIALIGGGTGLIGDPSGKSSERPLLTNDKVAENLAGVQRQLEHFLDFGVKGNPARVVNNLDWLGSIRMVDFLRDVGKYFTVNYMLARESVKRRLSSEDGLSFTEFTYMLLQAYDFYVLHQEYGCEAQMGGSDQWGNILSGTDLIRKLTGEKAHGLVIPLVTNASGTKFGKTESGAIWLDPELTSPFQFYQFWLNTEDQDVDKYLKFFTLLNRTEIEGLADQTKAEPHRRQAQHALAEAVTQMVHGEHELARAVQASGVLFGGSMKALTVAELEDIFEDVPSTEIDKQKFEGEGMGVLDLFVEGSAVASRGEARRLIQGGGAYLNNERLTDAKAKATLVNSVDGRLMVLRTGRKRYFLVRIK